MSVRDLLARTLQAEAGNQGLQGMIDVGAVINNRLKSGRFGGSLRDVIMSPGQFSAWNAVTGYAGGEQGQDMSFTPKEEAYAAADAVLSGDYTTRAGDALNYFAVLPNSPAPSWANASFVKHGDHYFGTAGEGMGPFDPEAANREGQVDSALRDFALDMDGAAKFVTDIMPSLNDEFNQTTEFALNLVNNPRGDNRVDASFAEVMPDTLPTGQRILPNQVTTGGGVSPTLSTSGGGGGGGVAEAPAEMGFVDRALASLMPNREPDQRRDKAADILSALSMGLGQMSAGAPVNVSPVMNRIQQRQQEAARLAEARRLEAIASDPNSLENRLKMANLRVAEQNAATSALKADVEQAKFLNSVEQTGISDGTIDMFAAYPETQRLIPALKDANPDVVSEAVQTGLNLIQEREKARLDAAGASEDNAVVADAIRTLIDPTVDDQTKAGVYGDLTQDQMKIVNATPAVKEAFDPSDYTQYMEMLEEDPNKAEEFLQFINTKAGQGNPQQMQQAANFAAGQAYRTELFNTATFASNIDNAVDDIIRNTDVLAGQGYDSGKNNAWKAEAGGWVRSLLPKQLEKFEEIVGIDTDAFLRLDGATQKLVFMASRPMVEGQGTITDSERTALARSLAAEGLSNEERLKYAAELKAYNAIENGSFNYYDENKGTGFQNHEDAQRTILNTIQNKKSAIGRAWAIDSTLYRASEFPETYGGYVDELSGRSTWDILTSAAVPIRNLEEFEVIRDLLPDNTDKFVRNEADGLYYHLDERGELVAADEERLSGSIPFPAK